MTTFVKLLIIAVLLFFFLCICAYILSRNKKNEFIGLVFGILSFLLVIFLFFVLLGLICCT